MFGLTLPNFSPCSSNFFSHFRGSLGPFLNVSVVFQGLIQPEHIPINQFTEGKDKNKRGARPGAPTLSERRFSHGPMNGLGGKSSLGSDANWSGEEPLSASALSSVDSASKELFTLIAWSSFKTFYTYMYCTGHPEKVYTSC